MRGIFALALLAVVATGTSEAKADSLVVQVDGVDSSKGSIRANLCGERDKFPGACATYTATSKAQAGQTALTFNGVARGRYALQLVHDENDDGRPQIPGEGFAFGNNVAWPPTFDTASIEVAGDARTRVRLTYFRATAASAANGAAPAAGVRRVDVRDDGLYAELYLPDHDGKLPTIMLLGGSEGGLDTISSMADSFVQQGFAVLALAYWAAPGLPASLEMVPLEYFDRAVAWVRKQPQLNGRLGVIGWSRGSEAALLLAARNRDVGAVAAVAPSSVVWQGLNFTDMTGAKPAWTERGRPLAFVTPTGSSYRPNAPMTPLFTLSLAEADRRPEAAIPIERASGPVLLISGGDDNLWPSEVFAGRLVARLQGAGFRHGVEHLSYPAAGHAIFVGAPDSAMARRFSSPNPLFGGSPESNAAAWADNWPKTLAFFNKALKENR